MSLIIKNQDFRHGDCLQLMENIPDGSIDMILCDLPYGTTQNKWDVIIPFHLLWSQYWRVIKPNGAVVLTAQTPFDKALGFSQIEYLKYEWVWEKSRATGHLNAKKQPMKAHEQVLVFYRKQSVYNPQKTFGHRKFKAAGNVSKKDNYGDFGKIRSGCADGSRYPRSVQIFTQDDEGFHPTQKPVKLFEYMIKTYTNEGDTILDNCSGSGTAAIAAHRTGRKSICIEKDLTYWSRSVERMWGEL